MELVKNKATKSEIATKCLEEISMVLDTEEQVKMTLLCLLNKHTLPDYAEEKIQKIKVLIKEYGL